MIGGERVRVEFLPFRDIVWDLKVWWRHASTEVRNNIIDELQREPLPSSVIPKADCRFVVDYSNEVYVLGDGCVYAWTTESGEIIYIGCGDPVRATTVSGRNDGFNARYENERIKPFILCVNIDREIAYDIETLCIWKAQVDGWQLENKAKVLSFGEVMALREKKSTRIFEAYEELNGLYPEVANAFDAFSSYCKEVMTSAEKNVTAEYLRDRTKRDKRSVRHVWTIDGTTKPARDWCKTYGKAMPWVIARIDKHGCTPKEALLFPALPHEYYKKKTVEEYWTENGYFPGSDTTSYVTPKEEWPDDYIPYTL